MKKKLIKIGDQIIQQLTLEAQLNTPDKSIGYFEGKSASEDQKRWILRKPKASTSTKQEDITGAITGVEVGRQDTIYTTRNTISRDSLLGRLVIQGVGHQEYENRRGEKTQLIVELLSKYATNGRGDALNGQIVFLEGNQEFSFASLIRDLQKLKDLEQKVTEDEKHLQELEKESEEAKALQASITQKETAIKDLKQKVQLHIATELALRDQPVPDKYQDEIRRSNILDGSLIINGGPGTGKTTTLIQRITFLTSETIQEEIGELSPEAKNILFNKDKAWVFYSPTELLSAYLVKAMTAEGLLTSDGTVRTWDNHRQALLRETGLIKTEKRKPFVNKTMKNGGLFFKHSSKVFDQMNKRFMEFLLQRQLNKVQRIHDDQVFKRLNTKTENEKANAQRETLLKEVIRQRDNSKLALKFRKIESWVAFYINMQKEFSEFFKEFNREAREELKGLASVIQVRINKNEETKQWLSAIVIEEIRTRSAQELEDDEDELEEEEIEEFDPNASIDVELAINRKLSSFIRSLALYEYDKSNSKFSAKNRDLLEKLKDLIDFDKIESLGVSLYFKKNFEKPSRGLESNLFGEIPATYKIFRRTNFKDNKKYLTNDGIKAFDRNLENRNLHLYAEEADYLLSFIFRLCKRLFNERKLYFKESNHAYISTFRNNSKGVVAIDEATDFSIWELAAMTTISHPLFDCVTLSGDLMQRMTEKGISSWDQYTKIFPKTDIRDLLIAYRQTAKLLEIASIMYQQNVNEKAQFKSHYPNDPLDPDPLVCVSQDEEDKTDWLIDRILEIQHLYGSNFPSVAIFVKDDSQCLKLEKALNSYEELEEAGLSAIACVQGKILGDQQNIRIYAVEYIKGLEFGVVFYHNLDQLDIHQNGLANKYVYVGLSRANLFLGVTLNEEFRDDLKVLEPMFKKGAWKNLSSPVLN